MEQAFLIQIVVALLVPVVGQVLKAGAIEGSAARWLVFGLSVVASVFIVILGGAKLPPVSDPVAFIQALGPVAVAVFGVSQLVYGEILKRYGWLGAEKDG